MHVIEGSPGGPVNKDNVRHVVPNPDGGRENVEQAQHQVIDAGALQQLLSDVRDAVSQIDSPEMPRLQTYVDTLQTELISGEPDQSSSAGRCADSRR